MKKIKINPSWTSSTEIHSLWSKFEPHLNNIELTTIDPDHEVDINQATIQKSILVAMEPYCYKSGDDYTVKRGGLEYHLSKTRTQLTQEPIVKSYSETVSSIVSSKIDDPGQFFRVNFLRYLDIKGEIKLHIFGSPDNGFQQFQSIVVPYHQKDLTLFPYKYTFNAENNSINDYFTEKIVDAILSETLCFYWGCPNLTNYLPEKSFIRIDSEDFKKSEEIIKTAILNDEYSKRKKDILVAKKKILTELNIFPTLEKLVG
jgi:hypothetical protein